LRGRRLLPEPSDPRVSLGLAFSYDMLFAVVVFDGRSQPVLHHQGHQRQGRRGQPDGRTLAVRESDGEAIAESHQGENTLFPRVEPFLIVSLIPNKLKHFNGQYVYK
jgi:hypothetical protein